MKPTLLFGPAITILFLAIAPGGAQPFHSRRGPTYGCPQGTIYEGRSSLTADQLRFACSGTRGRLGLGADPRHPEGPGNFSSPGF